MKRLLACAKPADRVVLAHTRAKATQRRGKNYPCLFSGVCLNCGNCASTPLHPQLAQFALAAMASLLRAVARHGRSALASGAVHAPCTAGRWSGACGQLTARFMSAYPEHIELTMPALSPTMETGTVAEWLIEEGGAIAEGQALVNIETVRACCVDCSVGGSPADAACTGVLCILRGRAWALVRRAGQVNGVI